MKAPNEITTEMYNAFLNAANVTSVNTSSGGSIIEGLQAVLDIYKSKTGTTVPESKVETLASAEYDPMQAAWRTYAAAAIAGGDTAQSAAKLADDALAEELTRFGEVEIKESSDDDA